MHSKAMTNLKWATDVPRHRHRRRMELRPPTTLLTFVNVGTVFWCVTAPVCFALFAVASALLPVVCVLVHTMNGMHGGHVLETALSTVYTLILVAIICLAPSVIKFQEYSTFLLSLIGRIET